MCDGFLLVYLVWGGSASWICRLMSLAKFGRFSAIISSGSFSPFSPSFRDSADTKFDLMLRVLGPWDPIHFLCNLFSLSVQIGSSPLFCLPGGGFCLFPVHSAVPPLRFRLGYCVFQEHVITSGQYWAPPRLLWYHSSGVWTTLLAWGWWKARPLLASGRWGSAVFLLCLDGVKQLLSSQLSGRQAASLLVLRLERAGCRSGFVPSGS